MDGGRNYNYDRGRGRGRRRGVGRGNYQDHGGRWPGNGPNQGGGRRWPHRPQPQHPTQQQWVNRPPVQSNQPAVPSAGGRGAGWWKRRSMGLGSFFFFFFFLYSTWWNRNDDGASGNVPPAIMEVLGRGSQLTFTFSGTRTTSYLTRITFSGNASGNVFNFR